MKLKEAIIETLKDRYVIFLLGVMTGGFFVIIVESLL